MKTISGVMISDDVMLSFEEVCRATRAEEDLILQLIDYHVIEPKGISKKQWQFDQLALKRARLARNFYYDLEVNLAGIGVLLDLLERIEDLERDLEKRG